MKNNFFLQERLQMVELMKQTGIDAKEVIDSLTEVQRHLFVPQEYVSESYNDYPLKIGFDQTISQPFIVAYMTQELQLKSDYKVLEIGTGSGYQAAILSRICKEVYTIEVIKELYNKVCKLFNDIGYKNIFVKNSQNHDAWINHAPFDAIIVTAASKRIAIELIKQLKINAQLIMPYVKDFDKHVLLKITRDDHDKFNVEELMVVRFVPMKE